MANPFGCEEGIHAFFAYFGRYSAATIRHENFHHGPEIQDFNFYPLLTLFAYGVESIVQKIHEHLNDLCAAAVNGQRLGNLKQNKRDVIVFKARLAKNQSVFHDAVERIAMKWIVLIATRKGL